MATDYRAWLAAEKAKNNLVGVSDDALAALEAYLEEGSISAAEAVERLVAGRNAELKEKARQTAYEFIVAAALDYPDHQEALVALVAALFADPSVDMEPYGWGLRATHDTLKIEAEDAARAPSKTGEREAAAAARLGNFAGFMARSLAAGTVNVGKHFLVLSLPGSLEAPSPATATPLFETLLPGVTGWLTHAAPQILAACRDDEGTVWSDDPHEKSAWDGKKSFNLARWAFWKARLEELRLSGKFSDSTDERLRAAFVAMEKAERAKPKKK